MKGTIKKLQGLTNMPHANSIKRYILLCDNMFEVTLLQRKYS